jgi:hypothetical protein
VSHADVQTARSREAKRGYLSSMALSWNGTKRTLLGPVVFVGFGAGVLSQVKRYDQRPELRLFLSVIGAGCLLYGLHHLRKEGRPRKSDAPTPDPPQPQQIGSPSSPLPLVTQSRWSPREWLQCKQSLPKRIAAFFAIYLAAAAMISIRVPVVVSGVAYESWGRRAYSYEAGENAFTLMTKKTSANNSSAMPSSSRPPATPKELSAGEFEEAPAVTVGTTPPLPAGFGFAGNESAPALNVARYALRLEALFVVIGALWFGVMPYYSKLKRCAWLLPLFVYAIAAIWRLLYVPCIWAVQTHYTRPARVDGETRALWDIGTAQVRYGLVFFEEFVLLVIVAVCYGCVIAVIRQLWPDKQIFPFLAKWRHL